MNQTRRIQLIVGGLLVVVLGLLGSLMAIPFLIGEPLQVVRPGSPALLADVNDGDPATLQIQVGASGDFLLLVAGDASLSILAARFDMPVHQMASVTADVSRTTNGIFRLTGRLDRPGRWYVEIDTDDESIQAGFVLAEF